MSLKTFVYTLHTIDKQGISVFFKAQRSVGGGKITWNHFKVTLPIVSNEVNTTHIGQSNMLTVMPSRGIDYVT